MSISREYNIPLASLSTFRMGGNAKEVVTVETEQDLEELFRTLPNDRKWFVLGGGSNIIFPDGDFEPLIIRLAPQAVHIEENQNGLHLHAPAGALWDEVVAFSVEEGLSGLEPLSAIPGLVGATPIQNVGAYGRETSDLLVSVRAFDVVASAFVTLTNEECQFGYRDSIFKHEGKSKYIITEVTFLLSHDAPNVPQYPGVAEYFADNGIQRPTLLDIRNAIIAIRAKKLPDPREIASVGSFFKNPFVSSVIARKLKEEYPSLTMFPVSDEFTKMGAGSLIDSLGLKGKNFGTLSIYSGNALVLVNEGGATRRQLTEVVSFIIDAVQKKYGITLEPEPELLEG